MTYKTYQRPKSPHFVFNIEIFIVYPHFLLHQQRTEQHKQTHKQTNTHTHNTNTHTQSIEEMYEERKESEEAVEGRDGEG